MQTLKSLILMSPLERKCSCHFSRFIGNVINLAPKWASNWCRWVPLRPENWQKWGLENISKTRHKKTLRFVQKWSKKRVPKKWYLRGFSGFHPSMVSRASLGRLPGSKTRQNGGPDMDFLLFWDHAFTFFGDTLEYFLCCMNYKLIVHVLDVQFTIVFA